MKILVINSGSSSIKYELFDMHRPVVDRHRDRRTDRRTAWPQCNICRSEEGDRREESDQHVADHREGLRHIAASLPNSGLIKDPQELDGIGHRVVHGGEKFRGPTLLDEQMS